MLQRIHDSSARWVAVILLGLVSVGFIFWGADFGNGRQGDVRGESQRREYLDQEFDRELKAARTNISSYIDTELSEELRRELRRTVLEDMVRDAVLKQRVDEQGYRASDARVDRLRSASIPAFQVGRRVLAGRRYRICSQTQGLTAAAIRGCAAASSKCAICRTASSIRRFCTPAEFRRYIELFNHAARSATRCSTSTRFAAAGHDRRGRDLGALQGNQARYQTTETVDLEYVELTLADIAAAVDVSDDALRKALRRRDASGSSPPRSGRRATS